RTPAGVSVNRRPPWRQSVAAYPQMRAGNSSTVAGSPTRMLFLNELGKMVTSTGALAGEDPKVAAEVIAITRAQWAAEAQGKSVAEQNAVLAEDYTEFHRAYPVRLGVKALNSALTEALARSGDRTILGDMQNAKVQVYGDVAILTYNYVGVDLHKDGKTESSVAKSTRRYVRIDGQWNWYTRTLHQWCRRRTEASPVHRQPATLRRHAVSIDQNPGLAPGFLFLHVHVKNASISQTSERRCVRREVREKLGR